MENKKPYRQYLYYREYLIYLGIMTGGLSSHNAKLNDYFYNNEVEKAIRKTIKYKIFAFWFALYHFTNRYFYGYDLVKRYKLPYWLFGEKYNFPKQPVIKIGKQIINNIHIFFGKRAKQYCKNTKYNKLF